MVSEYLKSLADSFVRYKSVLIYGAGGVAKDMLTLLKPYIAKEKFIVVVTRRTPNEDTLDDYPVRSAEEVLELRENSFTIISVMPVLAPQIEDHLKDLGFRDYCSAEDIICRMYEEIWKSPIERKKIVFSDFNGKGFGGNSKYIALELLRRRNDMDFVWIVNHSDIPMPNEIRKVLCGSYEHYWELGTAHIWIDNQHKSLFAKKRSGQVYIQTWHGAGPIKKIEFDAEGLSKSYLSLCEMNSVMEDLTVSPTGFNSDQFRRAFHYCGEIMECGYPRNDILVKPQKGITQKIKARFGVAEDEGVILYAPTFRNYKTDTAIDANAVRQAVERRFKKRFVFFFRFHPDIELYEDIFDSDEASIDVTDYDDVQELLAASDVLITDYSSIMWDFSLQMRPVFLFHPDLDRYAVERGCYLPFHQMPYIEALSNDDLCEKIAAFDNDAYLKKLSRFFIEYRSFDRGDAAARVADRIVEMMGHDN